LKGIVPPFIIECRKNNMEQAHLIFRMVCIPGMGDPKQSQQSSLHTWSPIVVPDPAADLYKGIPGPCEIWDCQQVQRNNFRLVRGNDPQAADGFFAEFFRQIVHCLEKTVRQRLMRVCQKNAGGFLTARNELL
jgi:hypothetical protein